VTILSVDVGVIGFMTIWGINLDTISMITIIMSIGFSVDFAAHIAHAFVVSSDKDAGPKEKVKAAMGEIAWPILQGAASTILGVVVLADLDSYMVVAFFKTVFLVIILALIHGLVFLPVLLGIFVTRRCGAGKSKDDDSKLNTVHYGDILMTPTANSKIRVKVNRKLSFEQHVSEQGSNPRLSHTSTGLWFDAAAAVNSDTWIAGGSNPGYETADEDHISQRQYSAGRLSTANAKHGYDDSMM